MRLLALGLGLLLTAAPAIACVCIEPATPEQKREIAARIADQAVAVVDVELAEPMDQRSMRGEKYRVLAVHWGNAPALFELERGFSRGSGGEVQIVMTSCDVVPPSGERTTVVLFATSSPHRFRIGGTCDHLFVNTGDAIELIRKEARKLAPSTERG